MRDGAPFVLEALARDPALYAVDVTLIRHSSAALAHTTIRLVWLNLAAVITVTVLNLMTGPGSGAASGGMDWLIILALLLLFGLPSWRYATWLGRVRQRAATEVDRRRLTAWMGFIRACSVFTVVISGATLLYFLVRVLMSWPVEEVFLSPWVLLTYLLFSLAVVGLFGRAQRWVNSVTAGAGEDAARRLTLVQGTVLWVRAVQLTTLLSVLVDLVEQFLPSGRWLSVVGSVVTTVLTILVLECSLRFALADARGDGPTPPQGQLAV